VNRGCPGVWKPESRYGYATTEEKHAARKVYKKKQSAARAPIRRAQREAQAAWKWARKPLRTIDLNLLDRAEIARAREARYMAAAARWQDEAASIAPRSTTGAKTVDAVFRSSTRHKARAAAKGCERRQLRLGGMFSSVTVSSDNDGDDENESVSAASTPPSLFDSFFSASGPRPATSTPAPTHRGKPAKKFSKRGLGEEAKKSSRRTSRMSGASIASWVAGVAAAAGQDGGTSEAEVSSASSEGESGGSEDIGVENSSEEEGTHTLGWDDDTASVTTYQARAVQKVAIPLATKGTSSLFEDTKHADQPSTDDEGYHTHAEDLDVSVETNPTPSCSSSANTTLSTPTVLLSPNPPNNNSSASQQDTRDTQPEQQLSAKARGKLPWNHPSNNTQPSPSPSPSPEPPLSAKARGKLPLFSRRSDAEPHPRFNLSNAQPQPDNETQYRDHTASRRARKLARYREQGRVNLVARLERVMALDGIRPEPLQVRGKEGRVSGG
jgi:hypothetical protein